MHSHPPLVIDPPYRFRSIRASLLGFAYAPPNMGPRSLDLHGGLQSFAAVFSRRAINEEVSQRLPPICCTSA